MKKTTGNLPFEQQSAGKLLLTMCLPAVIIMVVMTVYHMTDLFFIGQLGDVTQLAAVSLVSPAIGIQSVFGTLIGGGGCAIIARRLGERKGGEREIAGSCLLLSLASGGHPDGPFCLPAQILSKNIIQSVFPSDALLAKREHPRPHGRKIKKTDGFSICPQRKTSHPFHPRSFHRIGQAGPPVIWTC